MQRISLENEIFKKPDGEVIWMKVFDKSFHIRKIERVQQSLIKKKLDNDKFIWHFYVSYEMHVIKLIPSVQGRYLKVQRCL